ncbi:MAG: Gfo/Idh/MocA family oxidoreductase [Bacillota bacterium]|nr:Gfo/Idh/MocA family oxidoreductase [Bacillota bacterium]NLJ02054.1 Gfo/Idh/MocA family oxidoreductase [Bacillota bacterium]
MVVRIGFLSIAHLHAHSYGRAINGLTGCRLVGIYDPDQERGMQGAKEMGTEYFADPAELLSQTDAVIICSENSRHREFTELAAKHGCHVLCEKPIATTLEDARAMIDACARAGVKLQIAFPVRFVTPVLRVKEMLDSGAVGKVLAIVGTNQGQMPGGWFADPELAGGGAVMDHTVHVVDLIRWFLGKEFVSVYAEVDNMLWDTGIDDCGMLSMELEDGTIVTQDPSWSRPMTFPTWGNVTMRIIGTQGMIDLDAFAQNFVVYDDAHRKVSERSFAEDMDLGLIQDFIQMIVEDREPTITGYDGLKALEVALAAYRSAQEKKPVALG